MFVPSSIRRDSSKPLRTRTLENGTIVVEDAYEGILVLSESLGVSIEIKGISTNEPVLTQR